MTTALYDALAAAFYRQTGVMAPGKDLPAALADTEVGDDVYRARRWRVWLASPQAQSARERFEDDLRDEHAECLNEASGVSDDEAREIEEQP